MSDLKKISSSRTSQLFFAPFAVKSSYRKERKGFAKGAKKTLLRLSLTSVLFCLLVSAQDTDYVFRARTELVLVNVTVRDKDGNFVRTLKPEDFTILEDNKPQKIASFDLENTDAVPTTDVAQVKLLGNTPTSAAQTQNAPTAATFKDRRMVVLFFDLSSMQPEEIERATTSAQNYVDKQMAPADLVAVVSLGNSLNVDQDFTADRAQLKKVLQAYNSGSGQGFEEGSTGTTEGTSDTGQSFTADDTEFNIFNTDRRLEALRTIAKQLEHVDQKKSLIYFSSGMTRTGIENQSELRAATNAAVRANMAIYTMDIRGLQAIVPGGEAQSASLRGVSTYSGQSTLNAFDSNFSSQETLVTLAGDTGGRAYLDSNDFSKVFKGMQDDTSTYYMLGYHSSNPTRDGRYRHITVKLNQPGLKLQYRKGYYAPSDFKHSNDQDRERQLDEELASNLPSTDLHVYLSAGYFRIGDDRFSVPLSLVVPGSEIPFTQKSDQDKATLDIIGLVTDEKKRPMTDIRDTVKLAVATSTQVRQKNVQYNTSFILPSGKYHFKFVLRENETGRMGSFEADVAIPDLKSQPLKMSSVILASQLQPAKKGKNDGDPLVRDGSEVIPNVTHVFSSGQHLYLYYEVYDPAKPSTQAKQAGDKSDIKLLTSVAFFQGKTKTYETPLVEAKQINAQNRHAAVFQLDVGLTQLKPGFYICQVNVVDDAAGKFLFPRLAMLVHQ
jgi:VWFA-related protein